MTGKTHMAIAGATVAVAMAATGVRASGGVGGLLSLYLIEHEHGAAPYAIAGLLLFGMVAGLFPDLDAPDTELQHLPRRAADRLGRYVTAGRRGYSPLARLVREVVRLVALPFTLIVGAVGAVLRASTGHRGFTHTLLGALVFTGLVAGAALLIARSVEWTLAVSAVWLLGYASHLAADACTPSGIPLLGTSARATRDVSTRKAMPYPGTPRTPMFHLLPRGLWIRTGTIADTLLIRWTAWAICAIAVALMSLT